METLSWQVLRWSHGQLLFYKTAYYKMAFYKKAFYKKAFYKRTFYKMTQHLPNACSWSLEELKIKEIMNHFFIFIFLTIFYIFYESYVAAQPRSKINQEDASKSGNYFCITFSLPCLPLFSVSAYVSVCFLCIFLVFVYVVATVWNCWLCLVTCVILFLLFCSCFDSSFAFLSVYLFKY